MIARHLSDVLLRALARSPVVLVNGPRQSGKTTLLRLLGRPVHSVYGPSVDTGGLPINNAATVYAYPDIPSLIEGESRGGAKAALPGPGQHPSTERPDR